MTSDLKINEAWIKERINLADDKLEDIKTLSLPGTYQEKITHLGSSLLHFNRLKELDLSRNAIESLDGLEHLLCIEKLNLYYNAISTLNEIYKLRSNTNLQDLDLRLNPVARNEPDYRLFVIHMLPSLQRLDDRSIREQERKAALMHFGTDQAKEFSPNKNSQLQEEQNTQKTGNPRAQQVERMRPMAAGNPASGIPPLSSFGDDLTGGNYGDDHGNMMAPRGSFGNNRRSDTGVESYRHKDNLKSRKPERLNVERKVDNDYSNIDTTSKYNTDSSRDTLFKDSSANQQGITPNRSGSSYNPHDQDYISGRNNRDQSSAPQPYTSQSNTYHDGQLYFRQTGQQQQFTPNPNSTNPPSQNNIPLSSGDNAANTLKPGLSSHGFYLAKICDLVDRYWNGSKSLHAHPRFQPAALNVLAEMAPTGGSRMDELESLRAKVRHLEQQAVMSAGLVSGGDSELREKIRRLQEENRDLQRRLSSAGYESTDTNFHTSSNGDEVERLKLEISSLKVKLKAYEQTADLANMLKESHKSLVTTNEHLMREIAENRERYQNEINQLRWQYEQLKRSSGGHQEFHGLSSSNGKLTN